MQNFENFILLPFVYNSFWKKFELHLTTFSHLLQPILVYMSKVDGKFMFSPVSVNFLTEAAKVLFAVVMLVFQVCVNAIIFIILVADWLVCWFYLHCSICIFTCQIIFLLYIGLPFEPTCHILKYVASIVAWWIDTYEG